VAKPDDNTKLMGKEKRQIVATDPEYERRRRKEFTQSNGMDRPSE
jgi:hypothetical protein